MDAGEMNSAAASFFQATWNGSAPLPTPSTEVSADPERPRTARPLSPKPMMELGRGMSINTSLSPGAPWAATNICASPRGISVSPRKGGQQRKRVYRRMVAARLHDGWRSQREVKADGTFEPRVKTAGGHTVDIANLYFEELPEVFQESNLSAAHSACRCVEIAVSKGKDIESEAFLEYAADAQHEHWVTLNRDWAEFKALVAYDDLPRLEKAKCQAIVQIAVVEYQDYLRRLFDTFHRGSDRYSGDDVVTAEQVLRVMLKHDPSASAESVCGLPESPRGDQKLRRNSKSSEAPGTMSYVEFGCALAGLTCQLRREGIFDDDTDMLDLSAADLARLWSERNEKMEVERVLRGETGGTAPLPKPWERALFMNMLKTSLHAVDAREDGDEQSALMLTPASRRTQMKADARQALATGGEPVTRPVPVVKSRRSSGAQLVTGVSQLIKRSHKHLKRRLSSAGNGITSPTERTTTRRPSVTSPVVEQVVVDPDETVHAKLLRDARDRIAQKIAVHLIQFREGLNGVLFSQGRTLVQVLPLIDWYQVAYECAFGADVVHQCYSVEALVELAFNQETHMRLVQFLISDKVAANQLGQALIHAMFSPDANVRGWATKGWRSMYKMHIECVITLRPIVVETFGGFAGTVYSALTHAKEENGGRISPTDLQRTSRDTRRIVATVAASRTHDAHTGARLSVRAARSFATLTHATIPPPTRSIAPSCPLAQLCSNAHSICAFRRRCSRGDCPSRASRPSSSTASVRR